jgi:hypothetical protein
LGKAASAPCWRQLGHVSGWGILATVSIHPCEQREFAALADRENDAHIGNQQRFNAKAQL